jgi:hypothetical protein
MQRLSNDLASRTTCETERLHGETPFARSIFAAHAYIRFSFFTDCPHAHIAAPSGRASRARPLKTFRLGPERRWIATMVARGSDARPRRLGITSPGARAARAGSAASVPGRTEACRPSPGSADGREPQPASLRVRLLERGKALRARPLAAPGLRDRHRRETPHLLACLLQDEELLAGRGTTCARCDARTVRGASPNPLAVYDDRPRR